MSAGRNFSTDVEDVANEWHLQVLSDHAWCPQTPPGTAGGIGEGFYVTCGSLQAFAKPTALAKPNWDPLHQGNVAACHEKIAADLAHMLQMPVPPALLWDCRADQHAAVKYRCVSLVPFTPFYTWKQVMAISGMPRRVLEGMSTQASAMRVFDTWLDNRDRVNAGNVIVGMERDTDIVRCAYIDFAQSMSYGWGDGPPPAVRQPVAKFPGAVALDLASVEEAIVGIEALSEDAIRSIVDRIPSEFTPSKRRTCIVDGLLARRAGLRRVLLTGNRDAI